MRRIYIGEGINWLCQAVQTIPLKTEKYEEKNKDKKKK